MVSSILKNQGSFQALHRLEDHLASLAVTRVLLGAFYIVQECRTRLADGFFYSQKSRFFSSAPPLGGSFSFIGCYSGFAWSILHSSRMSYKTCRWFLLFSKIKVLFKRSTAWRII